MALFRTTLFVNHVHLFRHFCFSTSNLVPGNPPKWYFSLLMIDLKCAIAASGTISTIPPTDITHWLWIMIKSSSELEKIQICLWRTNWFHFMLENVYLWNHHMVLASWASLTEVLNREESGLVLAQPLQQTSFGNCPVWHISIWWVGHNKETVDKL